MNIYNIGITDLVRYTGHGYGTDVRFGFHPDTALTCNKNNKQTKIRIKRR